MPCAYFDTTQKGNHSATLTPTVVGGRRPLPSEICAQGDSPLFEKCRLLPTSAYNVSTIRDSEKSSIMTNIKSTTGFPTSYRWSAYVTPNPERVVQNAIFWNKSQFPSNKVEVSLCENFQWQSCSTAIPVSNDPYISA